jgi:hypothetical protein
MHVNCTEGSTYATVYVTDYTSTLGATAVHNWCPEDLHDKLLRVEMSDTSRQTAAKMQTGEYWQLNNVRVKQSAGGVEARIREGNKQSKLEPDDRIKHLPLGALLECVASASVGHS